MKRGILAGLLFFFTFISSIPAYPKSPRSTVHGPQSSYYAVWADTGEPIEAYQENEPLNPASTIKLITSYCALKELGTEHPFETHFFSEDSIQNETVGHLWVKGEGDPSMVNESLLEMVLSLKNRGLKKVSGNLLIDDSYFDGKDFHTVLTSAVPLNFNSVEVQVQGDGRRALVNLVPATPYLVLQNNLKIGGRRAKVFISVQDGDHSEIVKVSGRLPSHSAPLSFYHTIHRPEEFFGAALAQAMKENGIEIQGTPKVGKVNGAKPFWSWKSKPLGVIIQDMNKFSNNFIAEQLTKYLGAKKLGPPGTTEKGTTVLSDCLKNIGADTGNLFLENGSGLSYENRVTAAQLVGVLVAGFKDPKIKETFISSLSINGVDGTMKSRRSPVGLKGVLMGKTGSLNGVSSLAGYVPAENGRVIAFAILMNHLRENLWKAHQEQDDLVLMWREKGR